MKQTESTSRVFFNVGTPEARNVVTIVWTGTLVCFAEWCNLNDYLDQQLGTSYDRGDLVRLTFRAIPETESEYNIDAEIALPPGVSLPRPKRLSNIKEKKSPRAKTKRAKSAPLVFMPVLGAAGRTLQDQEIIKRVAALPTRERLHFYNDVLSKYESAKLARNLQKKNRMTL